MAPSAAPTRERVLAALAQLSTSRAPEARLVLQAGPIYLVWIARAGESDLEQESVSSTALPAAHKPSSEGGMHMRALGFAKRSGRRNWKRRHPRDRASLERVVDETLKLLAQVYSSADQPLVLSLLEDARSHPQNPGLIAAMREVAKGWDEAKRHAMYTQMLNATFLMPVSLEQDPDAEGSEVFVDFETHASGRPTLGAFTDWASLRLWEPRGHEYWPIHGSQLFELALERHPVTMRINPNGDVGGELYAHELEMLVRAVQNAHS